MACSPRRGGQVRQRREPADGLVVPRSHGQWCGGQADQPHHLVRGAGRGWLGMAGPAFLALSAPITAAAGHDTLAKLMYAWNMSAGARPLTGRHSGAELMYYGGTLIEVALAVILMTQWYLASGRALARTRRRSATIRA